MASVSTTQLFGITEADVNTPAEVCGQYFSEDGLTRGDLNVVGLVVVILFYLVILGIGILAARIITGKWKSRGSEDTMVAGRSIGLFVGIFTMTATWVGGGYINGTAEYVLTPGYGLAWTQAPWGFSISLILGGLFYAKKMREARYATMLDPLQEKYGRIMAALCYIPALCGDVFWLGSILSALGASLTVIIGLNHIYAVIISAVIAVLYTLVGGLYSVAYTDVIQLICIFVGLWLAIPFALMNDAVSSIVDTAYTHYATESGAIIANPPSLNMSSTKEDGWVGTVSNDYYVANFLDYAALLIFGGIPWQVYFQRVLSQKTARKAQILSVAAGFGCFFMAIPSVIIGAIAFSTDWNATAYRDSGCIPMRADDYKLALPLVLQYLTPTPVAIIGLGAVSAAVMSSCDSAVLSSGSQFARNVYVPLRNAIGEGCFDAKKASETEILWVMRFAIFVVAACGTIMAILVNSIYGLFLLCADLIYVILFPQLTLALYMKDSNSYGSLLGWILGLFFRITGGEPFLSLPALIKYPWYDEATDTQLFPFRTLSMLICMFTIISVSYLTKFLFKTLKLPGSLDVFECFHTIYEMDVDYKMKETSDSNEVKY